jgi:hypothetical protein
MENLEKLKYTLSIKKTEQEHLEIELNKVKSDIVSIERELANECKKYVQDNSQNIISIHPHYTEKHIIEERNESYYDHDWYRNTYGIRNPVDSFGLRYDYKGPNSILYTYCRECEVYFNKEYKKEEETDELSGEEIFRKGILKIEQKKLEQLFRGY